MAITGQNTRTPEEEEEYQRYRAWRSERTERDHWGDDSDDESRMADRNWLNAKESAGYDPLTGEGTAPHTEVGGHDAAVEGIPVWDWLSGAVDRRAAARAADEQRKNEQAWQSVGRAMPTVDALTPEYGYEGDTDEYGNLIGDPSQFENFDVQSGDQRYAMDALRNLYESGGYTDADYAARRQAAMERGQQLRGANEAALQQAGARGMSGGGQEMLARLTASQGMAQGQAMNDAQVQQAAMQRALNALTNYHSGADTQQRMEYDRRQALDNFNSGNTDWRRGREERNTGTANAQQDANTAAQQQAWENRYHTAQGYTNRYPGAGSNRDDDHEDEQGLMGLVGGILDL